MFIVSHTTFEDKGELKQKIVPMSSTYQPNTVTARPNQLTAHLHLCSKNENIVTSSDLSPVAGDGHDGLRGVGRHLLRSAASPCCHGVANARVELLDQHRLGARLAAGGGLKQPSLGVAWLGRAEYVCCRGAGGGGHRV